MLKYYTCMSVCIDEEKLLLKGEEKGKQRKVGEVRDKTALQMTQQDEDVIQPFLH